MLIRKAMKAALRMGLLTAGLIAAFTALPAAVQNTRSGTGDQIIVVTGRPLEESRRALAECLARKCPPNEDIDATLAHAENLFVAGDYKAARQTTLASIARNRRHAAAYPVPVADLSRANGRIAAHLGEGRSYESSANAVARSLKAGVPDGDPRIIGAELEKAGMYASLGRVERARQIYARMQREALRLGGDDIAAQIRLRAAWLHQLESNEVFARAALKEIAADRTPAARTARAAALLLLARLDRERGKPVAADSLAGAMRELSGDQPVLLFSPRVDTPTNAAAMGLAGSGLRRMPMQGFEKQWVDVGFRIGPEGRVGDVELVRSQGSTDWAKPLLQAIAGRLYSPVSGSEDHYRVERYSLTSLWDYTTTGSHRRQRSPQARIEMLDLTAEPEPRSR
jgi:tetratricopeptide (TPR) repeat protein